MKRNLQAVTSFAAKGPFSEGQLRWWIFTSASNGLDAANAVVRVGRRVYIDLDRFDDWIEQQNRHREQGGLRVEGCRCARESNRCRPKTAVSLVASRWAWKACAGNAKVMLLALAEHADQSGYCFPGLQRLASMCEVSESTAHRMIKAPRRS